jgi:hypothetical protein
MMAVSSCFSLVAHARARHRLATALGAVALAASAACSTPPSDKAPASVAPDDSEDPADDTSPQGIIVHPPRIIDDRGIDVDSTSLEAKRSAIIEYLWGTNGLPTSLPTVRTIPSPVDDLVNLRRVDELRIAMDGGETGLAQHFIADRSNRRLVIMALGHLCTLADADRQDPLSDEGYGQYRTLRALLAEGYSVLVTYMPHMTPEACQDVSHGALISRTVEQGHPAKWFLEPVAVALHYLTTKSSSDDFPSYYELDMVGLSGGGWTTTLYAAIDPRVKTSIPIAGSVPIYLRSGSSIGDAEQVLPELYEIAGYPELYALGAAGEGRRQVQVLNRKDNCCFGEKASQYNAAQHGPWDVAMRGVELAVQKRLSELGDVGGKFRLEIDEAPNHHTISWNTIVGTILAELDGGLQTVGAASASRVFMRHAGTLWERSSEGWRDTSLPAVGRPAVTTDEEGNVELFYRSPSNVLMRASEIDGAWHEETLPCTLISDPVAERDGATTLVAGMGRRYAPIVVDPSSSGGLWSTQTIPGRTRAVGTPALVRGPETIQVYVRGLDGALYIREAISARAEWSDAMLASPMIDFPAAIRMPDGSPRVYFHESEGVRELWRPQGATSWSWNWIFEHQVLGTPALSLNQGVLTVHGRTPHGGLRTFAFDGAAWTNDVLKARIRDSFVSVGGQVFGVDVHEHLWTSDGQQTIDLGAP